MPWWLKRTENPDGEWSVADLRLGYRVCAYHHRAHGGTHVHHPEDANRTWVVDVPHAEAAEVLVRGYSARYETFSRGAFEKEVKEWKSGSSKS